MDLKKINGVIINSILNIQEKELHEIYKPPSPQALKMGYKVPSPSKFGFEPEPEPVELHNTEDDIEDVTKYEIEKAMHSWNRYGSHDKKFGGDVKPSKGKLNKSQKFVIDFIGKGIALPFISNALLFADELKKLNKNQRKALLSLVLGGKLKLYKVRGSLPGDYPPSKIGAKEKFHYKLVKK